MTSFASMRDGLHSSKANQAKMKSSTVAGAHDKAKTSKKNTSFILFNLVTDYTLIFVMLVKMYFAIIYGYKILHNGPKDEEFLFDEQGDRKQKARDLSAQRKGLQNYYMQSITFQRFSIVQSISLIWIFCDKLKYTLKLSFVIIYSILFLVYLSNKMAELLE